MFQLIVIVIIFFFLNRTRINTDWDSRERLQRNRQTRRFAGKLQDRFIHTTLVNENVQLNYHNRNAQMTEVQPKFKYVSK